MGTAQIDRVLAEIDAASAEAVAFTADLVRIPTVNPPGEAYDDCAHFIGDRLERCAFDVEYFPAEGLPEHTQSHPRINVVGTRHGRAPHPVVHLNGHFDVVPAGEGWTHDPFGGDVVDGRIYGRGSCDMKAGIAAALFAVEGIRRAGVELNGAVEISGTVDEESGGFAGVAWLAEHGRLSAVRTDYVIIPEPLYVDRICIGHRGVYWFEVLTRGRIAHGSMPFLGTSAIDHMGVVLDRMQRELGERPGRKGRGAEGKTPFVAAVETTEGDKPHRIVLRRVKTFSKQALKKLACAALKPGAEVLSDGLACFSAVVEAGCSHKAIITGSGAKAARAAVKKPTFKWVNTALGNIKAALVGTYRAVREKHAARYLAEFEYRFNRRYDLGAMIPRLARAALATAPMPYHLLKLADLQA